MNPTQPQPQVAAPQNTDAIKAQLLARGQQGGQPQPPQGAQPTAQPAMPQQPPVQGGAPAPQQLGGPMTAAGNPEAKIILGAMASRLKLLPTQ